MKNFIFTTLTLAIISVLLAGCNVNQQAAQPNANTISQPQGTSLNLLISTEDSLKYCNGADMDSEGYKKTLTKKFQLTNFEANLSRAELIRKALVLAASQSGISFPQAEQTENYIKIINDTAYIQPTDGWAGVSIALCSWQPFVEVNLLRFPEIKKVEWVNDLDKWQELK